LPLRPGTLCAILSGRLPALKTAEKNRLEGIMAELMDTRLYAEVKSILELARSKAYAAVNFAMVEAYWEIGRVIVEKQGGESKSEYGRGLVNELSARLTADYGKGFTPTNLKYMRQFYLIFPNRHALRDQLSWTQYRLIMKVENENARQFYLDECVKANWSSRQLERQINSSFYERLLSSRNRDAVSAEIQKLEPGIMPQDVVKDPYVLEFLGLPHNQDFFESDLEKALLTHMQKFLLELGRGFTFEARQKRISFDGRHFYIDLVFYNYILKCFVLIDLKTGDLTHQDIGQMQMYVNYYTKELMNEGDNPPIGIILCADKSEAIVKYTLPDDNAQIFTSKYKLYLPTEEELRKELEAEHRHINQEKLLLYI
jgi:predicted nuclease of restriction endonuclease-like (RecB) superfamily